MKKKKKKKKKQKKQTHNQEDRHKKSLVKRELKERMAEEDRMATTELEDEGDQSQQEDMDEGQQSSDDSDSSDVDQDKEDEEAEQKLVELAKQISENPFVYDNHIALIKILRQLGDLERLREARQKMSALFPLTEELWLDWLHDELKLVADDQDRKRVEELFEKAFVDYQSVPIWLEYVQFAIGRMGEVDGVKTVRDAFEKALTAVGIHVSQGCNIWEAYREFETALCAGLMPAPGAVVTKDQEDAFSIQNQRVITIFKRQLAIPLLNMQNTLQEYKEWLSQDSIDRELQVIFDKAWKKLEEVQPYEDRLLTTRPPNVQVYQDYIQYELKAGDPARVQCLFERALADNCLVVELWLQYTKYLDKLKLSHQINSAYERAVRNCPWSSQLWVNYLLAKERQNAVFPVMKEIADKALSVGFSQPGDYLAVWCQYCDYLRRRIKWNQNHEEELETYRMTVEAAANYMSENFGREGDPEAGLLQTWALTEAKFCKNMEKSREIWTQIMQSGHGAEASLWLTYFRLERMCGDSKHCRRILQKALNSVTDWPEGVTKAYIDFEREEGDLEQLDTAMAKCEAQMERINERRAKTAEKEQALQNLKKKDKNMKKSAKKQAGSGGVTEIEETHQQPHQQPPGNLGNKNKRKLETESSDLNGQTATPVCTDEPHKKRLKKNPEPDTQDRLSHGQSVPHDPTKDNVTAFVSNLDFSVEEDKLREVFQNCGQIVSIRLVRNYKGKSKGFGYVEFTNSSEVLQALKLDRQLIEGRPMFVSRCEDRSVSKSTSQFKYPTKLEKNKLFIKGLPFTITKEELEAIFKEHGRVKEVRMVTYRNGSPKGLAYVEYDDEATAAQALVKTDGVKIGEHIISVAISNPPERKTPLLTRSEIQSPVVNLGSGKRETEFRGKARTQVSLLPRALLKQKPTASASTSVSGTAAELNVKSSSTTMSNEDFRKLLNK